MEDTPLYAKSKGGNGVSTKKHIHRQHELFQVFNFLWDRMGTKKGIFLLGILLNFSQAISMMLDPLFVSLIIKRLETGEYQSIPILLFLFMLAFLILTGFVLISEYIKLHSIFSLNATVMTEMASVAQKLPLELAQSAHSSDLVQRITHDTPRTTNILTLIFDNMADQLLMLILAAIYLLWIDWKVALCILAVSPLMLLATYLLRNKLHKLGKSIANQESIIRKLQQDYLQNMETIQAFGINEWALERFEEARQKLNILYTRRMWLYQLTSLSTTVLSNLMIIGTVLIIGSLYMANSVALGSMIVYFTLIWRVNTPLQNIGNILGQVQESLGSSSRIFNLLNARVEPISEDQDIARASNNEITLKGVCFTHSSSRGLDNESGNKRTEINEQLPSIQNINLHFPEGTFVAITGPSGSGKTTLGKIISGLLCPTEGTISIAGINPMKNVALARKMVAYVPQSPTLFTGTIRENLTLAGDNISEEKLIKATKLAQIHEFITKLPDGYNTEIKEQGKSLSGGQKQRLAIARALLTDRPIWVFDEATSALDLDTEREIVMSILREADERKKTLVFIAHRISSIKNADIIVVLKDGQIHQIGEHYEIIADNQSLYNKLWNHVTIP